VSVAESARFDIAAPPDAHPTDVDIAIDAFQASDLPGNRALADFIGQHAARLTSPQRQALQRLVTWPVRGPERSGGDLGMTALLHFADSEEVAAMWSRWIRGGAFDGTPCSPAELAAYLVEAQRRHAVAYRASTFNLIAFDWLLACVAPQARTGHGGQPLQRRSDGDVHARTMHP